MKKIGVLGMGAMGAGIVQVFAENGYEVLAIDRSQESLDKGILQIIRSFAKSIQKGRMTEEDRTRILEKINVSNNIQNIADCDLVIEAVTENLEAKKKVFSEMDKICTPQTIFATNTSSLSITEIAEATNRPDRVLGMYFFNPVPVMKKIEVIKGLHTSDETKVKIMNLSKNIRKTSIGVEEVPGL